VSEKALYAELTPKEFRSRLGAAPIAYLPLGTLEWHGEHLPLGADGIQSQGFLAELAREVGGIVLPMLFVGPDKYVQQIGDRFFYGMDILGFRDKPPQQLDGSAYWMDDGLFAQLLESILGQLRRAGFRIVVAHGHGPSGNLFRKRAPEWEAKFGLKLFTCWREDESDGMGIQTDHAAANETSLMMALRPDLVQMENLPQDPAVWPVAVSGKDPRIHASPERGRRQIEAQLQRMKTLLLTALRSLPKS
jgi:creatinine amidohydrolase